MSKDTSQSFTSAPTTLMRTVLKLALGAVTVLLIEAGFVLVSGWRFRESVLGGRITPVDRHLVCFAAGHFTSTPREVFTPSDSAACCGDDVHHRVRSHCV